MRQQPQTKRQRKSVNKDMLLSQNGAAQLLERDRGTLKRALRRVRADAFEYGQPRYKLSTVLEAMAAHTRMNGGSRSSGASPIEPELVALERADLDVRTFLKRLRAEPDLERRRALARSDGNLIGALDRAFAASITAQGPDATPIFTPLRDQIVASVINELLSLCEWKIAGEPNANRKLGERRIIK